MRSYRDFEAPSLNGPFSIDKLNMYSGHTARALAVTTHYSVHRQVVVRAGKPNEASDRDIERAVYGGAFAADIFRYRTFSVGHFSFFIEDLQ